MMGEACDSWMGLPVSRASVERLRGRVWDPERGQLAGKELDKFMKEQPGRSRLTTGHLAKVMRLDSDNDSSDWC